MADLLIHKHNEVYAKLSCEKYILRELADVFTFFVPGHQFTPEFRNRIWDGKIRLLNLNTKLIYLGLLQYIEEFCISRDYTFEFVNFNPDVEDEFSVYHAEKFIEGLKLSSQGRSIQPKEHQLRAFIGAMQNRRKLILSPTASGKSLIIYLLFRQLLDYQNLKGLIVVPTTSLVEQLYSDFQDYSYFNDFDVSENVHKIYQGISKNSEKKLVISTWQSIYTMPEEYFHQYDYVIGDEAHLFKANSLMGVMTKCINTKYRIGLTGTLDGTKTHKLVLEGLFGPVERVISTKELIDGGHLSDFEIKCLVLKHPEEDCKNMFKKEYKDELQFLILNEQRNKFIKNLAISLKKNTLILYQMVDKHGKLLYNMLLQTEKLGNRKVFFVHGGTETEDREKIRKIMETEEDAIIVASFGTFSTGINIRNLHNVIFASPSKSRVRNLQSIGRVLRKSDAKDKAVLYDISDDLRHGKYINHTLRHFIERSRIYTEEKFPFKLYKIQLKNGRPN
jgi:superfamily II DNA or RNA helicase